MRQLGQNVGRKGKSSEKSRNALANKRTVKHILLPIYLSYHTHIYIYIYIYIYISLISRFCRSLL